MQPADEIPIDKLIGKKVLFAGGEDHATCWHQVVGLVSGTVLRKAKTLAQKAQMIEADLEIPAELLDPSLEVPRVWVKVDACKTHPRGCETAVEPSCLVLRPVTALE